jgi:hypothetical protein
LCSHRQAELVCLSASRPPVNQIELSRSGRRRTRSRRWARLSPRGRPVEAPRAYGPVVRLSGQRRILMIMMRNRQSEAPRLVQGGEAAHARRAIALLRAGAAANDRGKPGLCAAI